MSSGESLDTRGEFDAIAAWTHGLTGGDGVLLGVGDDCAVLKVGERVLLVTTDAVVEGVHFNLAWYSAEDAGFRAMAGAISDIAAMGGAPLYATVSLAVPKGMATDVIDGFYRGLRAAAGRWAVDIVGGDTTRSLGGLFCDITVIGEAIEGRYLSRSGACPGDLLVVTGHPGRSAAALGAFMRAGSGAALPEAVREAHVRPSARVAAGRALAGAAGLHAMIDVSDGLLQDARHLAENSGVGLRIDTSIAIEDAALLEACASHGLEARECYWAGGEDYELAFAVAADALEAVRAALAVPLRVVGQFTGRGEALEVLGPPLGREGFDHFHE